MNRRINHDNRVLGGILLVAGCCIGAGMLGLPAVTVNSGFGPSLATFFLGWLFMASTGLLLVEANLWFEEHSSMVTLAGRTLGVPGKVIAWGGFLFLFYTLLVAYISGAGELVADFAFATMGWQLPQWAGSFGIAVVFGILVYLGTETADNFNRALMLGLVLSYVLLLTLGISYVHPENLLQKDWKAASFILPPVIISFGYHNLIPSLMTYLHKDAKKLRFVVLTGSAIPLLLYVLWEFLILGIVPSGGAPGFSEALNDGGVTVALLRQAADSPLVVHLAQSFAFFAIVTSLLGVALSFVDFLSDGFRTGDTPVMKIVLCTAVILPPFIFSLVYPKIFITALNYAGAYGAVLLFGILPAAMVYTGRYRQKREGRRLLPGGKVALLAVFLFAITVIVLQTLNR